MTEKKFFPVLVIIALGLAFFGGLMWQKVRNLEKSKVVETTTQNTQQPPAQPAVSIDTIKDLFKKDLIKFGDEKRKVLFVEISDPSCPYCQAVAGKNPELNRQLDPKGNTFKLVSDGGEYVASVPEMRKLVEEGKASFVWMYYPGHSGGEMAAKALYCANDLGKFWEVNDLLTSEKGYEIQNGVGANGAVTKGPVVGNDKTKSAELANFLKSAVDPVALKECLDSGKYEQRLAKDQSLAGPLIPPQGGTPTFYVNSTVFGGAYSYTEMKLVVDAALK